MTNTPLFLTQVKTYVEQTLKCYIDALPEHETTLISAMRYSLLLGGKRVRPALVFATASLLSRDTPFFTDGQTASQSTLAALDCACAIEAIHTYSLVHDDLPAMDDDDMRRGQPSCHKVYGEAQAILAGDALQTIAFTWIAESSTLTDAQKVAAIQILSRASGVHGMVQGQAIDLTSTNSTLSLEALEQMHSLKTGALIAASVELGAICANATPSQKVPLNCYARAIGLAFQVQDDILDVTSTTEQLGKQVGSDASLNKPTYVTLLGVEGAKQKTTQLVEQALEVLAPFDEKADILRDLAIHIAQRTH